MGALLCVLAWLAAAPTAPTAATADADLEARFALAAVPGLRFRLATGTPLPPARVEKEPQGLGDINWQSAPDALVALRVDATGLRVLLSTERGDPLLLAGSGEVVIALDTQGPVRRWPYFNYLLHAAACAASGRAPPRFGDWEHSPLLGARARRVVAIGGAALWTLAFLLYRFARRRGRARPDAAQSFFAQIRAGSPDASEQATWSRAGFGRPLAGLLTLLAAMLLLVGPYFALQSLLASRVQPFPEADGLWQTTFDTLWIAWLTFDLGTQTAFVKYFAEYRVSNPGEALRDVQFYVWWQVFSRLVEITLLVGGALGYLPFSRYAIYAPFVALYASCYVPSVSAIGKLMCQALQRFDFQNLLDMAEYRILKFLMPIPFVLLGRNWGVSHPIYGEAFGAALGLGLGQLAVNLVMLVLGLFVLRHLKVPIGPLFLAQFDRQVARRQLVFGVKATVAQEPYRLTSFLASLIIFRWLKDFPTWLGLRDLLSNRLIWLYFFAWAFYQSAVPAVSEALSAGKRKLTQYYVARYLQFGFLFSATIFSLLLAVGPSFIHGALGPQWGRAADYLLLAALGGLLLPPAWLSDSLQQGAGRPGLNIVVMLVEQSVRLALLLLLVPHLQFTAIYAAELIALGLKALVAWAINHSYIVRLPFLPWTMLGSPLAAGALNYLLWWAVAGAVAPTHATSVLALFFVAGASSFFACFFLCGLCGGFDRAALEELDGAARMSALVRP